MQQEEVIKKALIKDNLNFLNTIYDDRFGEIHLYNNKINKKEYIMAKDKFIFELDQLKKEIDKSQQMQIKIHPNFLHLLDYSISKTFIYKQECYKITKYFEYSNRNLRSYKNKLQKEPNFQFKEEFIARLLYDILDAIDFVVDNKLHCGIISPKNIIVEQQGLYSNKLIPIFNNKGYNQQYVRGNQNNGFYLSPKCFNFFQCGKEYQQTKKDLHFSLGLVILEVCLDYQIQKVYNPSFQSKVLIHMLKKFMRKYGRSHVFRINQITDIKDLRQQLQELLNPDDSSEAEDYSESDDLKDKSTNNSLSPKSSNFKSMNFKNIQRSPLQLNFEKNSPIVESQYGLRISRQISIDNNKSQQNDIQIQQKNLKENQSKKKFKELYKNLKRGEIQTENHGMRKTKNHLSNKVLKCHKVLLIKNNKNYHSNYFQPMKQKARRIDFRQLSNNYKNSIKIPKKNLVTTPAKKTTRISLLNESNKFFSNYGNKTFKQFLKIYFYNFLNNIKQKIIFFYQFYDTKFSYNNH